jgi:branched-chain amino acid transport system substrate-binding protein
MGKKMAISVLCAGVMGLVTFSDIFGLSAVEAASPSAPAEIKIGATLAITGRFSVEWGPPAQRFMEALEGIINDRGGVYVKEYDARLPIKLIIYDDASSPDRAVELYEKLATVDRVNFFLGPATSPITIKASTVAEKYGIPFIGEEANSPYIYARGFKWIVGVDMPAPQWAEDYYKMMKHLMDTKEIPQLKTVAIIKEDTPHTLDQGWGAEHYVDLAGLKIISNDKIPMGMSDFSPLIIKFKESKPDIVYAATWGATGATFAKQAYEMGYKPFELHIPHATLSTAWYKQVGPEIAEGITGVSHVAPFKHGDVAMYNEALKRTGLGLYDFGNGAMRFLALQVLTKGIEKAGTLDRAKVMEAIKGLHYQTLHGEMYFKFGVEVAGLKVNGVGSKLVFTAQWQKGDLKILWPPDFADGKYMRR